MFDLDEEIRAKHLYEMTVVAEAVKNAFGAQKMNYECLGNGDGGTQGKKCILIITGLVTKNLGI